MNAVLELTAFRGLPVWELPAAHYLLMIQAGAFALLAGCAGRAFGLDAFAGPRRWGVLSGAGLVLAAPLNLVAELLSPERFPSMLYRPHPSSPLSWGVVAILALTGFGLAECLLLYRAETGVSPGRPESRLIPRLSSLAALGVVVYTAIEIGNAKGVGLWSGFWPLAALVFSGLAAGLAVSLGLTRLAGPDAALPGEAAPLPGRVLALACALSGLALLGWGALTARFVFAVWPEAALLPGLGVVAFLLAAVLSRGASRARFAFACALALAGAWAARVAVLSLGQAAALGRNLGEPLLTGHAGLLTALAPPALWLCLMLAASLALGRLPGHPARGEARP